VTITPNAEYQEEDRWFPPEPDRKLVTEHRVTVTGLFPNAAWYYYVVSTAANGKTSRSPEVHDAKGQRVPLLSFKTLAPDPKGPPSFTIWMSGATRVYAGSDLYVGVRPVLLSGPVANLYDLGATIQGPGPQSIATAYFCQILAAGAGRDEQGRMLDPQHKPFCWGGNNNPRSMLRLRTTLDTKPGDYVVHLKLKANDVVQDASYTFHVLPAPEPLPPVKIGTYPPIPGKARWEQTMLILADKWCKRREDLNDQGTFLTGFGWEGDAWYYDGGRVYLQVADYHPKEYAHWAHCAALILGPYRDYFNAGKSVGGWRLFPYGLAMDYWRTGDDGSKQAVMAMAAHSPYVTSGGEPDFNLTRETAYMIDVWVAAEELGAPRNPLLLRSIDFDLGHLDQFEAGAQVHPFMVGLCLEALINYYEMTVAQGKPDLRIPAAVKTALDFMWDGGPVDKKSYGFFYNHFSVPASSPTDLNLLVAPAFAWYWSKTGNNAYLQRGDILFEHSLDAPIDYSGKIFSQNYKWSFDYVRWRSGIASSTTSPEANPRMAALPDSTPPIILTTVANNLPTPVIDVTGTSATFVWKTYRKTDCQVVYGLSARYGQSSLLQDADANMTTDHKVILTGLMPGTTYHYRLRSRDAAGNLAQSRELTFTTSGTQ
jgi:chitodextrinase